MTKDEAKALADQAVAALRDAIRGGWSWPSELKAPDFDPLREREDFKKLLTELEQKSAAKPEKKP